TPATHRRATTSRCSSLCGRVTERGRGRVGVLVLAARDAAEAGGFARSAGARAGRPILRFPEAAATEARELAAGDVAGVLHDVAGEGPFRALEPLGDGDKEDVAHARALGRGRVRQDEPDEVGLVEHGAE